MKDESIKSMGIWEQRHYNYLKRKSPTVINAIRMQATEIINKELIFV